MSTTDFLMIILFVCLLPQGGLNPTPGRYSQEGNMVTPKQIFFSNMIFVIGISLLCLIYFSTEMYTLTKTISDASPVLVFVFVPENSVLLYSTAVICSILYFLQNKGALFLLFTFSFQCSAKCLANNMFYVPFFIVPLFFF